MEYCKRCLYPVNHPLGIVLDDFGICSGCLVHEEKDSLDWSMRLIRLERIFESFRVKTNHYDCIVPVSGGRDSYFIVHTLKVDFGLNPLLVSYNNHYNTRLGIRNLAHLKTQLGCDHIQMTASPESVRNITSVTLEKMGSIHWHCLAGSTAFPVHIAVKLGIPLIIWGAHQGLEQVGMFSHLDEVEMTEKYRKEHDLMGFDAETLANKSNLTESDLLPFCYPKQRELEKVGVRGIYLGNFIRWDSKAQQEKMIARYGYQTALQQRTFNTYDDVDSFHYSGVHDYIKFLKWGFGKVTDHASREIRFRRMSREDGIVMVNRYNGVKPRDLEVFLKWIGISKKRFFELIDRFRDTRIWNLNEDGNWRLLDSVNAHRCNDSAQNVELQGVDNTAEFLVTSSEITEQKPETNYQLVGRGYTS